MKALALFLAMLTVLGLAAFGYYFMKVADLDILNRSHYEPYLAVSGFVTAVFAITSIIAWNMSKRPAQ